MISYSRTTMKILMAAILPLPLLTITGCSAGQASVDNMQSLEKNGKPIPVATNPVPVSTIPVPVASSFAVGMNVENSIYYSTERSFANLAQASDFWRDPNAGLANMPDTALSATGYPIIGGVLYLNVPQPVRSGINTSVTCTWTGSGSVHVDGNGGYVGASPGAHTLTFNWPGAPGGSLGTSYFLRVENISSASPFGNLNCREPGVLTNGPFDQRLVDNLKPYSVLRFLGWSTANDNPASVTWANRATPEKQALSGTDGVALEHRIDLANAAGSDLWLTIPWNADQDYVQKASVLVRDRLSPNHKVYFELSNEVWNYGFRVAAQAREEGLAENLSTNDSLANLLRYAEKTTWFQKIISTNFSGQMSRVVRVLNVQNANSWAAEQELTFKDTAQYIDVITSAPYFGHGFFDGVNGGVTDLPTLFASLETARVQTIDGAVAVKTMAEKYGKTYVTYEGGQHIIPRDGNSVDFETATQMQRSPLMFDIYTRYLNDLKARGIGTVVLLGATGPITKYGAWGVREYAGQPLTETPKLRAILQFTR